MSDQTREQIAEEVIRLIGERHPALSDTTLWREQLALMLSTNPAHHDASSAASRLGIMAARRSFGIETLVQEFSAVRRLIDDAADTVISPATGWRKQFLDQTHAALDLSLSRALSSYLQVRLIESRCDAVTSLPDRAAFEEALKDEVERAERYQRQFALVIFDVDDFKSVNDRLGHPEGDRVLAEVGSVLKRSLRRTDQIFRYGGDEFAAICLEMGEAPMMSVLRRLEGALGELRISYGVAYFPSEASDRAVLVKLADERLYECKRAHHRIVP